uniref:RAB17, member RAS oncogene family n=1 Tax=Gopherus agassizii TaxID=38772 RepID=A0A452IAQ4_9SAUR
PHQHGGCSCQVGAGRPSTEQAYISKVVLLGRTAMGKSSTAFRYVKNDIRESMTTVGCSFFTQLGTAGQEMYHSVCHLYYRGANAAFLVYDIARKATFVRAKLWLRELEKEFLPDELVIVLVSNKADLAAQREVTFEVKSVTAVRSHWVLFAQAAKLCFQFKQWREEVSNTEPSRQLGQLGASKQHVF